MQLLLRVRPTGGQARDLAIEVDPESTVAALTAALAQAVGPAVGPQAAGPAVGPQAAGPAVGPQAAGPAVGPPVSRGGATPGPGAQPGLFLENNGARLEPQLAIADCGLVSGLAVMVGPPSQRHYDGYHPEAPMGASGSITLDVVAGPEAGRALTLTPGHHVVGRDPATAISIQDPTLSQRHFLIDVRPDGRCFIAPEPRAATRVLVNGRPATQPVEFTVDATAQAGATVLAFRGAQPTPSHSVDRLGLVAFHRTPYRPSVTTPRNFEPLGDIPMRPESRRFSVLTALAPLGGGLALYAFSRRPEFLALTALTPLCMLASWWDERRCGGRRYRRDSARFRSELAERRREVEDALQAERVSRMRAAPHAQELALRAAHHSTDLWQRGRDNDDFLDLRLGLGEVASQVRAPVAGQGDADLRREAIGVLAGHDRLGGVPIVVPMAHLGTLALLSTPSSRAPGPDGGTGELVQQVAASLVVQVATQHSPEDVIICAAVRPGRLAEQVKWLPHTRSLSSPLEGLHLATSTAAAHSLCTRLAAVAQQRTAAGNERADRRWPRLFVLLDDGLELNPAVVGRLLDLAAPAGISVAWLTASPSRVPQQAQAVLRCLPSEVGPSDLWFRDPARPVVTLEIEPLHAGIADRAVRALAPLRDAGSTALTSAIPREVPLFAALGLADDARAGQGSGPLARSIVERWAADAGYALTAPFGITTDGVIALDLVADGPHALIGGTSGSGKSELLVALVAGLITRHPPSRVNLLFIDFKGGAASSAFRSAPHTVGYVTNLNGALANRALVSLRAELNRRMHLMEGRAKDLGGMLASHPDLCPPSLVIVVDEFATLVKEIPEFVAGIVDIAQRGRSLGIHLILATQRPSGAVNENILANTNARISLRMIDGAESASIIAGPEAAAIPVPLRGRGYARLGPGQLIPFQAAYAGAPVDKAGRGVIQVEAFVAGDLPRALRRPAPGGCDPGARGIQTQLEAVLAAVDQAAETLHLPPPRAPWLDELPAVVPIEVVLRAFTSPPRQWWLPLGEFDDPQRQRQDTVSIDLEECGGCLVYGAGGSGKTTVLRTLAGAAVALPPAGGIVLFGLDFASRALRSLDSLDACAGVATGDDLEAVTRLLTVLEREVVRRRGLLAGAERLSSHLANGGAPVPRLLLLVDGYCGMRDVLTGEAATATMHGWLDRFHRLVTEGRQVGLHTVITSDRPHGVAPVLTSVIGSRLILRQVDEQAFIELGVPACQARGAELGEGRGFLDGDLLVQVACLSDADGSRTDGASQMARLRALALKGVPTVVPDRLRSRPLSDAEHIPSLPAWGTPGLSAPLGIEDLSGTPVFVDLEGGPLVVAGPQRSGRSTTLATLVAGLQDGGADTYVVGPASSPLRRLPLGHPSAFAPGAVAALATELAQLASTYPEVPRVLVVDDADQLLDDPALWSALDPLARCDAVRVVASLETASLVSGYFQSVLLQRLKKVRRRLLLQPLDGGEIQSVLGVRYALRPGLTMPPGRGVLLAGPAPTVVQVGLLAPDAARAVVGAR